MDLKILKNGIEAFASYQEKGTMLVLALFASAYLLLRRKPEEDDTRKGVRTFAFFVLLLLLCPGSADVLLRLIPDGGGARLFALAPVVMLVALCGALYITDKKDEKKAKRLIILPVCAILALCALAEPWSFNGDRVNLARNMTQISSETRKIKKYVGSEKAIMPSELMAQINEYGALTDLVYGPGNSIDEEDPAEMAESARENDCEFLVIYAVNSGYSRKTVNYILEKQGYGEEVRVGNYLLYKNIAKKDAEGE